MNASRHFCTAMIAIVALASGIEAASAQALFGDDRSWFAASTENSYRTWSVEEEGVGSYEVRQVSSRLFSTLSLRRDLDLVIATGGGWSQDRAVTSSGLESWGDLKSKAFFYTLDRRLLFSLGMNLPTGKVQLNDEEVRALQAVQPTVLGFRNREYGRGFDLDLGVATGLQLSPRFTLGGGVGYLLHGEYDLDEASSFKPGGEVTLTLGANYVDEGFTGGADMVYRLFGTDQLNGSDSFEEGGQLELTARGSLQRAKAGFDLLLRNVIKSENTILSQGATSSGGDTVIDNGNTLWLYAVPRYDFSSWLRGKLLFDLITANQSQQQSTGAWAAGFGLGFEVRLSPVAVLDVRAQKLTGKSEDDRIDLSGYDAVMAVRWQN